MRSDLNCPFVWLLGRSIGWRASFVVNLSVSQIWKGKVHWFKTRACRRSRKKPRNSLSQGMSIKPKRWRPVECQQHEMILMTDSHESMNRVDSLENQAASHAIFNLG